MWEGNAFHVKFTYLTLKSCIFFPSPPPSSPRCLNANTNTNTNTNTNKHNNNNSNNNNNNNNNLIVGTLRFLPTRGPLGEGFFPQILGELQCTTDSCPPLSQLSRPMLWGHNIYMELGRPLIPHRNPRAIQSEPKVSPSGLKMGTKMTKVNSKWAQVGKQNNSIGPTPHFQGSIFRRRAWDFWHRGLWSPAPAHKIRHRKNEGFWVTSARVLKTACLNHCARRQKETSLKIGVSLARGATKFRITTQAH